ncbi:MAG TPA: NADH-quinone oxidoreductase subunit K [Longimicrobiales bacterium]|nr:NADH-quinone oxidoreductase subunit K [Longimicrobiales bacterium]
MSDDVVFPLLGVFLFGVGFAAFVGRRHLLWKIIAVNVMASGVSVLLLTLPRRAGEGVDPVPQAMVLTGIVVMVAATALALALAVRLAGLSPGDGRHRHTRE